MQITSREPSFKCYIYTLNVRNLFTINVDFNHVRQIIKINKWILSYVTL
jgi:hypothetical protein